GGSRGRHHTNIRAILSDVFQRCIGPFSRVVYEPKHGWVGARLWHDLCCYSPAFALQGGIPLDERHRCTSELLPWRYPGLGHRCGGTCSHRVDKGKGFCHHRASHIRAAPTHGSSELERVSLYP